VSVLANDSSCIPLTLNRQMIKIVSPSFSENSTYGGGYSPYYHKSAEKAFKYTRKIIETCSGFYGYIGLDFVLTEQDAILMEINPRFTTSITGISMILSNNIAKLLLECVINKKLPKNVTTKGVARYSKVLMRKFGVLSKKPQELLLMDEILCPPLPTPDKNSMYAFISVGAPNLEVADRKFESILQHIRRAFHAC